MASNLFRMLYSFISSRLFRADLRRHTISPIHRPPRRSPENAVSYAAFSGIFCERRNPLRRQASAIAALPERIKCRPRFDFSRARDQQEWNPVLRPIALSDIERAHDLVAKPLTLWRIMRP
jgi:hypothetical protein